MRVDRGSRRGGLHAGEVHRVHDHPRGLLGDLALVVGVQADPAVRGRARVEGVAGVVDGDRAVPVARDRRRRARRACCACTRPRRSARAPGTTPSSSASAQVSQPLMSNQTPPGHCEAPSSAEAAGRSARSVTPRVALGRRLRPSRAGRRARGCADAGQEAADVRHQRPCACAGSGAPASIAHGWGSPKIDAGADLPVAVVAARVPAAAGPLAPHDRRAARARGGEAARRRPGRRAGRPARRAADRRRRAGPPRASTRTCAGAAPRSPTSRRSCPRGSRRAGRAATPGGGRRS